MSHLQEVIREFLRYLRAEKGASPETLAAYRSDLRPLEDFLVRERIAPELANLTTPVPRRYFIWLQEERKLKVNSLRRKVHCFRSFFRYLTEQEYIPGDPMRKIRPPKEPDRVPVYLKEEELKRLLTAPEFSGGPNRLRDKVILYLLAYCGLRRSELLRLDWDDVDLGAGTLRVRGKGGRERLIPIIQELQQMLWEYLQKRLPLENRALLLGREGGRMNKDALTRLFKRYVRTAGLDPAVITPHKLRHSFATLLLEKGTDVFTIQELMGHADLASTRIYAHCSSKRLREAVERIRPGHPDGDRRFR
ncbi:MAG: tyrosine-type recombinase/integrase [Bacillota bacterium]